MDALAIFFTNSTTVHGEAAEELVLAPPADEEKSSGSTAYCVVV